MSTTSAGGVPLLPFALSQPTVFGVDAAAIASLQMGDRWGEQEIGVLQFQLSAMQR